VKDGAQQDRIKGGSQQISNALAKRIDNRGGKTLLNSPVVAIHRIGDTQVTAFTQKGEKFTAKYVVIAAPPVVQSKIKFEPPLPTFRQCLIEKSISGTYCKCWIIYKEPFWRAKGLCGEALTFHSDTDDKGPLTYVFDGCNDGGAALLCLIAGRYSYIMKDKPEPERKQIVLTYLAKVFGDESLTPLEYCDYNWSNNEWTRGCPVSFPSVGTMEIIENFKIIRRPVGRIHFAGTETATKWAGYMDGAVRSAERVTNEIMVLVKGGKLDFSEEDKEDTKHKKKKFSDYGKYINMGLSVVAAVTVGYLAKYYFK